MIFRCCRALRVVTDALDGTANPVLDLGPQVDAGASERRHLALG